MKLPETYETSLKRAKNHFKVPQVIWRGPEASEMSLKSTRSCSLESNRGHFKVSLATSHLKVLEPSQTSLESNRGYFKLSLAT